MRMNKNLTWHVASRKIDGYFGIDIKPGDTVDATMDLEQFPWDIESESAEEIICSHYVEQL